ncbi:metallophosphoesterase [Pontibacter populi]|uniref:Metallophosphoesterase n=1 Tax=Pontibacter populi TaxID=890055 RepID=A0ABV1RXY6_9BACT
MGKYKRNIWWGVGATAVALAAGVLLDAFFLEKYFFQVKRFRIGSSTRSNKPMKLVLLADLHLKQALFPRHYKLARKVNELKPDLLLFAGDTLDTSGEMNTVRRFLALLDSHIKKVAVPGNHDYAAEASMEMLAAALKKYNGNLLVNQTRVYRIRENNLAVTGLDDQLNGSASLEKAVEEIGQEPNHLLLIHSPRHWDRAIRVIKQVNQSREPDQQLRFKYAFAGHTHGGQVRLPFWVPVLPPRSGNYVQGWYKESPPYLYVSNGFGTSRFPVRFFARAEVTVFEYYV